MATAFAPGHVSGVFAVHDEATHPLAKGSRGVGWSVDRGAVATVAPLPAGSATSITLDGAAADAPVTRRALALLSPSPVDARLRLGLPVGQGFGMSAAGSLAACLAAAAELDLDPETALAAAHQAEVEAGTGLGDAVGSWFGAGEIRMKPGCPPAGWAMRVEPPAGTRVLYCVLGKAIPTPSIIRDAAWKARTRELGDPAVDRVLAARRDGAWEAILHEAAAFSRALGLMPAAMRELANELPRDFVAGQSMLGNTLWATAPPGTPSAAWEEARQALSARGPVIEAGVDVSGARRVRDVPAPVAGPADVA